MAQFVGERAKDTGVVVDAGNAESLPAAERFADALGDRVRAYPTTLVSAVAVAASEVGAGASRNGARCHSRAPRPVAIRAAG